MKKIIQVFANKSWEADPLVAALRHPHATPQKFAFRSDIPCVNIPLQDHTPRNCAARVVIDFPKAVIEVWCIEDLMDPSAHSSSSREKVRVLEHLKRHYDAPGAAPSLVIAFGTAAFPGDRSHNGCVSLGSRVFVYNPYADNPDETKHWRHDDFGKLLRDAAPAPVLRELESKRPEIEKRFVCPPIRSAAPPGIVLAADQVALCSVNVTDRTHYDWVDPAAEKALRSSGATQPIGSVETTHGVIRIVVPSEQFLYISGIANRMGQYKDDVLPQSYAQNFATAHNAAVVLAWAIPVLAE